jgi:hypothetical protein
MEAFPVPAGYTCYHSLLLFNRDRDCLAAKLRPVGAADIFPISKHLLGDLLPSTAVSRPD